MSGGKKKQFVSFIEKHDYELAIQWVRSLVSSLQAGTKTLPQVINEVKDMKATPASNRQYEI